MTTEAIRNETSMYSFLLASNHSKTSNWWRSGDDVTAVDQNLEAYFKGLKACKTCGASVTSACPSCGGKYCSEHLTNHPCGRLLPSDSPGKVTEIGRSPQL